MILTIPEKVSIKDTRELYLADARIRKKVSKIDYLALIADLMQFIVKLMFQGHTVCLPVRTGQLSIIGLKISEESHAKIDLDDKLQTRTKLAPDWKATKELWRINEKAKEEKKLIFHFNEHSDGTSYKVVWDTFRTNIQHAGSSATNTSNHGLYKFTFSRHNKRETARLLRQGEGEFLVIDKMINNFKDEYR